LPLTSCQRKEEISHNLVIQISLNLLPTSVIIIIKKKQKIQPSPLMILKLSVIIKIKKNPKNTAT